MRSGLRFCPELFEHRARAIEALEANHILWMVHYGSVDLRHDDYGLEVCGIRSKEDATRVGRMLRRTFPMWKRGGMWYVDYGGEQGWRVRVHRDAARTEEGF